MYRVIRSPSDPGSGMGANLLPDGQSASFRVWAPNASAAEVLLRPDASQDYQRLPLAQDGASPYWSADVDGLAAGHEYRFNLRNDPSRGPDNPPEGGECERVDPRARSVRDSGYKAPGYLVDPRFAFGEFRTPHFEDFLIYQLQVGSFRGKNDTVPVQHFSAHFADLIPKLPYIKSMNFTAIQLLPCGEYPSDTGEGYAPTNFFAPESALGKPDELRRLVDACHASGLAVIFDVIYNHVPDDDDRLWQFDGNFGNRGGGIYFADVDRTSWGWRLATDRQPVHDFFLDNARMWLHEYGADGLRFDSLHNVYPEGGAWWLLQDIAREFPDKLLIAEHDNFAWCLGRYPLGAAWDMGCADHFRGVLANPSAGDLKNLIEYWGAPYAFSLVRYLLGSHDQIFNEVAGNHWSSRDCRYFVERVAGIGGREDWTARAKARLGWALTVAMPGTPMLFMGSEMHHYGYWCPDLDQYGDHRLDWALADDAIGTQMRALVADVNQVRLEHPALRSNTLQFTHLDEANHVLAFKRWNDRGDVLLTVVNVGEQQFSDATYGVSLGGDGGTWEEIFNSQSPQYGGWPDSGNYLAFPTARTDGRIYIRLPKLSVLIFRKR